jgi:hypothetical protein
MTEKTTSVDIRALAELLALHLNKIRELEDRVAKLEKKTHL